MDNKFYEGQWVKDCVERAGLSNPTTEPRKPVQMEQEEEEAPECKCPNLFLDSHQPYCPYYTPVIEREDVWGIPRPKQEYSEYFTETDLVGSGENPGWSFDDIPIINKTGSWLDE